jgi:putative MATE family efflux protein
MKTAQLHVVKAPHAAPPADPAVWPLVLRLAWPVLAQSALLALVALFDRWLAGGVEGLDAAEQVATPAAQTTAAYLAWFLTGYTMFVTAGSTTLVAYLWGAGERHDAQRVLHQSLLLAAVLGLAGSLLGLAFLEPVLALLRLEGDPLAFAAAYLRPLLVLLVFQMLGASGIACLAGAGDTRTGLWVLGGVALLNMPLAWVCCHGAGPIPGMGFTGIAVGTGISQTIGGLAVLAVLWHGRAGLRLQLAMLRPRLDLLARLLRVSVPAALDNLSMQVGHLWFLGIVNGLGSTASAAHGHALTWEGLGYYGGAAFGTAAVTVVGQFKGAGRNDLAARGGWTAFVLGVGLMSLMGAVFFALAVPMLGLFCPQPAQQPIIAAGVPVLRLVAFGMPALGSCLILAAALRGAGDTRLPMLITWLGFFGVRIPLATLLTHEPFSLGLFGAWLAMFADMHVRGLLVLWRFASGRWKHLRI